VQVTLDVPGKCPDIMPPPTPPTIKKSPVASTPSPVSSSGLPFPLPYPPYSQMVLKAEEDGQILLVRAQLVRETARFFLGLKHDLSQ
jgi:hypothetical protein